MAASKNKVILIIGIFSIISGVLGAFGSVPITEVTTSLNRGAITVENKVGILEVSPGSPAAEAGLAEGDTILAVNGTSVNKPGEVTALVNPLRGGIVTLSIQSKETTKDVQIVPRLNPPPNEGSLGVGLADYGFESASASEIVPNVILRSYTGHEEKQRFTAPEIYQDKTFSRLRLLIFSIAGIIIGIGVLRLKLWGLYGFIGLTLISLITFAITLKDFPNYLKDHALELSLVENGVTLVYLGLFAGVLFSILKVYFTFFLVKHKEFFAKKIAS